jgi:streptomycin 6-kinase
MKLQPSAKLVASCETSPATLAWLERLPELVEQVVSRWSLKLGPAIGGDEGSCAWLAAVTRANGERAILKLGMPHFEGAHEINGLQFWGGIPTVVIFEADPGLGAMLLERCDPGSSLRTLPEPDQDLEIARLLKLIWRTPPPGHPFRPLSAMLAHWAEGAVTERGNWPDPGLVGEGLRLFEDLSRSGPADVLLATDLHAGNVLQAKRERWLVIDPKPFVGDSAYDATQHLLNCRARLLKNPRDTICRFSDLLEVDPERVRQWTFARVAVESSHASAYAESLPLVRALASRW